MPVQTYVLVSTDPADLTIYGGPILWDGVTPFDPGVDLQAILETDADAEGYAWPTPPDDPAADLNAKLSLALGGNIAFLADTGTSDPQLVALTLQVDALIRLSTGAFDSTDGT